MGRALVKPIEPRLLNRAEAATYCGLEPTLFERVCPVRPMQLGEVPGEEFKRWDRMRLRDWMDGNEREMPTGSCVYAIGFGPYVKIGYTAGPVERRLADLQVGCPELLVVLGQAAGGTRRDEERMHEKFSAYWLRGDWFRLEGEVQGWIEAGCPL